MSQQSKTTLQSAINTQIADNTSGDISAADIRDNLINITDSLLFNTGSGQAITGSLIVTGGITGSLLGTASYATQALSASWAPTVASNPFPFTGSAIVSGSLGITGSVAVNTGDISVISPALTNKISVTDGTIRNEFKKTSTQIINGTYALGSFVYDPANSPFFPLSNAIYSNGATDLLISSEQKLKIEATSTEITGSLITSGSFIRGVALTSSNSDVAGVNYQSDLTTVIPSLRLASSDNSYNLRIFSTGPQLNYISSSHQLYLHSNQALGIKAGNGGSGNVSIATGTGAGSITVTAAQNMTFTASAATYNTSTFTINASTIRATGSLGLTGSLTVTNGITGSLQGTASWAINAVNATTAATASHINGTNTKTYSYFRSDYSYPTTASIVRHILPIFPSTFSSIDLTISKHPDRTDVIPIVVQLYASKNSNYTINTGSYDDVLIGTYSASLPSHVSSDWPTYRLKRSFYQVALSEGEPGSETTSFYFYGVNPTASILSDESSSILKELVLAAGPENTYIYPNLKITGQSASGSVNANLFSLGPVRVTF